MATIGLVQFSPQFGDVQINIEQLQKTDLSVSENKNVTVPNHIFEDRRSDVYGNLKG